jgi:hypothetical protein
MARLYADETFPLPVVAELRLLGHDVSTVEETGKGNLGTPDLEILEFAISQGRAVLTLNRRHFVLLHNRLPNHKGIIVCSTDNDFLGQANREPPAKVIAMPCAGRRSAKIRQSSGDREECCGCHSRCVPLCRGGSAWGHRPNAGRASEVAPRRLDMIINMRAPRCVQARFARHFFTKSFKSTPTPQSVGLKISASE